ncbi:metal-dependent hydrolase [Acidiferrimicrobium sp. IK]|uniref:metal-dependent hydrolase n=1 Tax=Acidiferrimicrobium sp. IK TaxID=2871700 RepID=UPI0021CB946C|nr:metal-dependent hydrolase [Acidiferrimicrobium sp. IK]MCU4187413.1 metal-dependent hydrolase [Acidiferrimicrobium sp. IK]
MASDKSGEEQPAGGRTVAARRITFEHSGMQGRYFFGGDLLMSHILALLSATFPKGEQFFVESVRNVRAEVTDDRLRPQVAGFIGQESMHGREHDRLNEVLAQAGYPAKLIDRTVEVLLGSVASRLPKPVQLATTAALEHYTAVLAEQLLSDETFDRLEVPDEIRNLFVWHALEECEHRAVAFDVFQDCYGSERTRILTMQLATTLLVTLVLPLLITSLATDRRAYNPLRLGRSLLNLRRSPFARKRIALNLLRYNRLGFHPDERDIAELLAHWRSELFGEEGALVDHLDARRAG